MNNTVQPFRTPAAPRYSCTSLLETGDPVAGVWFGLRGNADPATNGLWHPQDEVFANWFTRDGTTPLGLDSWDGRYTFTGSRTTSISPGYAGFGTTARGC